MPVPFQCLFSQDEGGWQGEERGEAGQGDTI